MEATKRVSGILFAVLVSGSLAVAQVSVEPWTTKITNLARKVDRSKYAWSHRRKAAPATNKGGVDHHVAASKGGTNPPDPKTTTSRFGAVSVDPQAYARLGGVPRLPVTREELAREEAEDNAKYGPLLDAQNYLFKGDLREARRRLEPIVAAHLDDAVFTTPLARVALLDGQYWEAFSLVGPSVTRLASDDTLLVAASSGVLTGNIVPGEVDYLREKTKHLLMPGAEASVPDGNAGNEAKTVAFLALGVDALYHNQTPYERHWFEKTLQVSPDNAMAEFYLAGIYHSAGELRRAVDAYKAAAQYGTGHLKQFAMGMLPQAQADADHPESWKRRQIVRPKTINGVPTGP